MEQFYGNYTYGHFLLAGYAAVPALLTPDLLYKLWQNFNTYQWSARSVTIHRIAVADLLLSPLCREIGYELYEMHPDIRLAFLQWLKAETATEAKRARQFAPIETLSAFLNEYYIQPNPIGNIWGDQYLELQQMDVLSYTQPARVAGLLKSRIREAARSGSETSLLRAIDFFTKTHKRLELILPDSERDALQLYEQQSRWLEAGRALVQQNMERFTSLLDNREGLEDWLSAEQEEGAIAVKVEREVAQQLKDTGPQPMLKALIVSGETEDKSDRTRNDAALLEDCLRDILPASQLQVTSLPAGEGDKQKVLTALNQLAESAAADDQVLIYFSCHCRRSYLDDDMELVFDPANRKSFMSHAGNGLNEVEMRVVLSDFRSREVILVLEAPYSGSPSWMNSNDKDSCAVITSCAIDQEPYKNEQTQIDDKSYSYFTYELVRQLKRKQGEGSIRWLFNQVVKGLEAMPQVRKQYGDAKWDIRRKHAPQIFASQRMLDASLIPGSRQTVGLQSGLQKAGFYHKGVDGMMDGELERAILRFRRVFLNGREAGNSEVLEKLESFNNNTFNNTLRGAVFLLVFSDPHKSLKEMEREKVAVMETLNDLTEKAGIELLILDDPDITQLSRTLDSEIYRGRIELFYYSGQDEEGDMVLADGTLRTANFLALLEFQRDLQVLILNTCRASHLAAWAAQMTGALALGGEGVIRDDYGATFAIDFFRRLAEGRSPDEYAEFRRGWFADSNGSKSEGLLRAYQVPWANHEYRWFRGKPDEKIEMKAAPPAPKILAVCWGISALPLRGRTRMSYPANNVGVFADWLKNYSEVLDMDLDISIDPAATRAEAIKAMQPFEHANDGDTCILFYSGICLKTGYGTASLYDVMFSDDTHSGLAAAGYENSLWGWLNRYLGNRKVNLTIIIDAHANPGFGFEAQGRMGLPDDSPVNLVMLEKEVRPSDEVLTRNDFFTSLMDSLRENATDLTYAQLLQRLKLKTAEMGDAIKINLTGNRKDCSDYVLFTSNPKTEKDYEISFNQKQESWIVNAGSNLGIRPSLNFMRTIFRTDAGQEMFVTNVEPGFSFVQGEGSLAREERYPAALIQNALPKVKLAFDMDKESMMYQRLIDAIHRHEIYYIDIVENERDAKYLVRTMEARYYLVRNDLSVEQQPVFDYQISTYEFIKQLEYIAQWTAMLELDNTQSTIERDWVEVKLETFVDGEYKDYTSDKHPSGVLVDPESLVLNYVNGHQPAFRCSLVSTIDGSGRELYVNALYLSSEFGIHGFLGNGESRLLSGETNTLSMDMGRRVSDVISVIIPSELKSRNVRSLYDYIKIFISQVPITLNSLEQDALEYNKETTRGIREVKAEKRQTVRLPGRDWTSITIPINVRLEEAPESFQERVQKLYKERRITVEDDLQKNRWGGKSTNNGWVLTANVEKKLAPGLYNVRIFVDSVEGTKSAKEIAIFLHDSFNDEIWYEKLEENRAETRVTAYEAFTVGAFISDGTMLELDLNDVQGLPSGFYYRDVTNKFMYSVLELYKDRPVHVPDDLQKGRWGGENIVNNKQLTATVKDPLIPLSGYYKVKLKITSTTDEPLTGDVAFFLHNSFTKEIRFRRAVNGEAQVSISAYEAFVVGAITEDGTMLELDLNKISGAPKGFYYQDDDGPAKK
ncbi:pYEATS domain-containing protein [Chitinophaga caseinilytica]|uniref:PYEATS domain-containing protein n=1 Tax=Chitinophaga caseinilytica TaxID=2267521 RepID=A0ABZ2Z5W7_9BACT